MPAPHRTLTRRALMGGGLVLGGATLAGCVSPSGSSDTASSGALEATGDAGGEISILDDNTNSVFKNGLIDTFQEQTGITVKNYEMANFNDLHDRFATMFAGEDSSYDVIMTWAGWSAEFGQAGWLQEISQDALPSDVIRPALDAVSWDGKVYGLPKFASVQTMFWNKEHFERAGLDPDAGPQSWEEFVAAAKKLTTDGRYGYTCDMGNPAGAYQNFLRTMLLCGGELYDSDWTPQLDSEAGVEAMSKLVELFRVHKAMDPASLQITNASDLVEVFAQGNTSIVFNWPFQWSVATQKGAKTSAETVGNGLLPGVNVRSASIDGSEGYAISRFSENKAAAMKWLEFASSATSQTEIVQQEGWFPVSQEILQDPATLEALPVVETYQKSTEYVTKRYGTPWSNELDQLLSVHVNRAMNGKEEPQEAMTAAQQELEPIVEKYLG
ncbi:extracellular solute-binding protein [Phycicoccus endophyticus]|uniref:Extracellular solute-binding protein n=1 Tax=Phycicoccus endophyticus TaxID=1690220 RepID=A0A7G9QZX7_9MICO|nr:extracellular solute-binding protein [Phycicoccus endophyticus]NHI20756.1 extracellular solute-binding protein [Phycicoccus endophyticus]QNN48902.1 extracellular solute-binding protein [Phycicoccus endophyticus]GGL43679.1 putative amino-acid ABC transporter periplasmic-binding protein y4oP [Phycicoccus endophyticus]